MLKPIQISEVRKIILFSLWIKFIFSINVQNFDLLFQNRRFNIFTHFASQVNVSWFKNFLIFVLKSRQTYSNKIILQCNITLAVHVFSIHTYYINQNTLDFPPLSLHSLHQYVSVLAIQSYLKNTIVTLLCLTLKHNVILMDWELSLV